MKSQSVSCSIVFNSLQSHVLQPARLLPPWDSPGKNTGVVCHSLLQEIFLTQELKLCLLNCRQILYHLSHQGSSQPWSNPFQILWSLVAIYFAPFNSYETLSPSDQLVSVAGFVASVRCLIWSYFSGFTSKTSVIQVPAQWGCHGE